MAEKDEKPKIEKPQNAKREGAAPSATPASSSGTPSGAKTTPTTPPQATAKPGAAAPANTATPNASAQNIKLSNQEDGAITEKVQLILVSPIGEAVTKLKNIYSKDQMIKIYEAASIQTPQMARQVLPCIIMGSITSDKDVVRLLNMLKSLRDEIRHNKIKFLLFTKIKNNQVIKAFESLGCKEIVTEPINERSLKFKIDLHLKAAKAQRKSMRSKELQKNEQKTFKADKKTQAQDQDSGESFEAKIKDVDPQGTTDDLWIFKGLRPKKQGRRLVVRVKGPTEDDATWAPVERQKDGLIRFRLIYAGSNLKEEQKKAGWEFIGEKPLYNGGDWNLTGEKVELRYVDEKGTKIGAKFWMDEKGFLYLAKDTANGLKVQEAREKRAQELKEQKKNALFSGKKKDGKEAREANDLAIGDEEESPSSETEDYVLRKEDEGGTEFNYKEKKEKSDGTELDYSEEKAPQGEGAALDYTEEKEAGKEGALDYTEEKAAAEAGALEYTEEEQKAAGTDLDYSEEKKQSAGTELDYSEEEKKAAGTDLDYSEEKKQSAATELDYSEKKKEVGPEDPLSEGKIEWPEEQNLDTPTEPISSVLSESLPALPLPPMAAVYMAEIMMRNKGDLTSSCTEFLIYISDFLQKATLSLTIKGKTSSSLEVLYSTDPEIKAGSLFQSADHPEGIQAFETKQTVLSKKSEGIVYIPVRAGVDPKEAVLGVLIIQSDQFNFKSRLRYFYSIGQCFRGVMIYGAHAQVAGNEKAAA